MKLKNIICSGKIILLAACFASCNYLDIVPPETIDIDNTMKDREAALGFLYSTYYASSYQYSWWVRNFETSVDEFAIPELWRTVGQDVAWGVMSPLSSGLNAVGDDLMITYDLSYRSLNQCYLFLKVLSEQDPKGVTDMDRERWEAEITFLKAFYHFAVLKAWGPVPIVEKLYDSSTRANEFPGRSHFDYCVDKIVGWLDEAAAVLPPTVNDEDWGRTNATVCKALKARVLLYAASPLWNGSFPWKNWQNTNFETPGYGKELVSHTYSREKWVRAKQACDEALQYALNQGNRRLFTVEDSEILRNQENVALPDIPEATDDFKKQVVTMRYLMTSVETDGNREIIWAPPIGEWQIFFETLPHGIVTLSATGNLAGGWSRISPFLYTMEHFYTKNGKLPEADPAFYAEDQWLQSAGVENPNIIKLNVNREPRYYAWLSFDGDEYSSRLADGNPLIINLRDPMRQGYNPTLYTYNNSETGFLSKKWIEPYMIWRSSDSEMTRNGLRFQVIRLAELYLNLAECCAALDDNPGALNALNPIRERAGIPALTDAMISESGMSLTDWIRNERFVELWGEMHRYYDLRRWMIAPEKLKAGMREGLNATEKINPSFDEFNRRIKVKEPYKWLNRMYLMPIASSEVYANPQMVQAPEY
jgi:hypothetical protein